MKYTTGFVVGKFSPLHRGHQLVIDRALNECKRVVIVSYSVPEFEKMPASVRYSWLNLFYGGQAEIHVFSPGEYALGNQIISVPDNSASDLDHRQFCARVIENSNAGAPDAVFTSEDYGDGFAEYLSGYFSKSVEHVCVDIQRIQYPTSGTQLRSANMSTLTTFVSRAVKNKPVQRVVLYGGESSGKTTLAERLAGDLKTMWVPEEGRYYTERKGGVENLQLSDMLAIARAQVSLEIEAVAQAAAQGLDLVVCDTSPLTTYFYSLALFDDADENLIYLADREYDFTVLCCPDFPFVQDGTRMDDEFRLRGYRWYQEQLSMRNIKFFEAAGTVDQRASSVMSWINNTKNAPSAGYYGSLAQAHAGRFNRIR